VTKKDVLPTQDEVEQKVNRENLRYRRWGWLSWLGRLLNFGTIIRPGSVGWPEDRGEAPMAELERLAKFGIKNEVGGTRLDYEDTRRVILLCNAIATTDHEVSKTSFTVVLEWVSELGPQAVTDEQRAELDAAFRAGVENPQQLRNEAFLLRKRLSTASRVRIVEVLYQLALIDGSNAKVFGRVADIGEHLNLKPNEIRLALVSARKSYSAGIGDSITTST